MARTSEQLTPGEVELVEQLSDVANEKFIYKDANGDIIGADAGDVVGPASATDNAIARYDSTTGKLIQNSSATIDDAGVITSTGTVTEGGASATRQIVSANNNVAKIFSWRTTGLPRWAARVDGNETGANAGGDWSLRRYDDAGTFIDAVLSFVRSTGVGTFLYGIVVPSIKITGGTPGVGKVLTSDADGDATWETPAAGGLTRDLWYSLTGSYASTSTFTTTEASNAEATRIAGLAERSLFTCTNSGGGTRRIGYIKSASASTTTVTYTVVTDSDLASGDINFRICPNRKVEDYVHRVSIPGEMIADASNPQGVWLLNIKRDSYLLPVNSAVRTAAAGAGAACAWNVYKGTTNLFTSAQDMTTSSTFDEKRPNTNTITAADNISLRITSSAGATNKASDFQAELFIVPQVLFTSQS